MKPTATALALALLVPHVAAQSTDDPSRLALLVGIEDYPAHSADLPRLRAPRRDVELVRDLLVQRFGFADSDVHLLLDADATLEGIVRAIDRSLLQRVRPGTEVVIYFSCHGSRTPDLAGRERDRFDSTIVAYDSRASGANGRSDLSDDALHALVRAIADRSGSVVVVSDTCHSGGGVRSGRVGATRSGAPGTEAPPPADSWSFWPSGVAFEDDTEARNLDGIVHIAGCAPGERAFEWDFSGADEAARWHGLFTWSLARALSEAAPGASHRDIAEEAAAMMRGVPGAPPQSVWTDGDVDRELFGAAFRPPPAGFEARPRPGNRLIIRGGILHGLVENTEMAIITRDGQPLGRARVARAAHDRSEATWLVDPGLSRSVTRMLARVVARPVDLDRLIAKTSSGALAASLADNPWVRIVPTGSAAADYLLTGTGNKVVLASHEGNEIWTGNEDGLTTALREETQFRALWQLGAPGWQGQFGDLRLKLVPARSEDIRAFEKIASYRPAPIEEEGPGTYRVQLRTFAEQERSTEPREMAILEIEVGNIDGEVALHVLNLPEDREMKVLAPQHDRTFTRAQTLRVPVWVGGPDTWPLARPMRDRYVVIASRRPIDFERFVNQRSGVHRGAGELPGVLQIICAANLTRGSGDVGSLLRGWGAAAIDLLVSSPSKR